MKLYPAYCTQKASNRAAQAERTDMIALAVGSEAPALCSECMHVMKKNPTMLLRCAALFIPGLLLVFLTSEISQQKF